MPVLLATPEEMKIVDRETISSGYTKAIELMERAGHALADEALEVSRKNEEISVFCGRGNNGGDGLVCARYLVKKGRKVKVYLLSKKSELKGEPAKNLERFIKLKGEVREIIDTDGLKKLESCKKSSLIIDALLGIGLKGAAAGLIANAIDFINSLKKKVISADIPSGLDSEKGIAMGPCIRAFETVTFGLGKPGLFLSPGINWTGRVKIVDIGLSPDAIKKNKISHYLLEKEEMAGILPQRSLDSHKGDFGHVFVIAGSVGLTGAATLAATGALRSGAGLVTLGIPQSLNIVCAAKLTEVMTRPLPEKDGSISRDALSEILDFSKRCNSIAIGPGLSRRIDTGSLVLELIENLAVPMVIDADGLYSLAGGLDILKKAKAPVILTPHPGEMARLIGKETGYIRDNKLDVVRRFSKEYNVIVVLKGAGTVISEPDGNVYINSTGNPSLSSGGTGDVLTGIIASFLGQGLTPLDAAKIGVYIHGRAADELSLSAGPWGIIATDILKQLPFTMHNLSRCLQ